MDDTAIYYSRFIEVLNYPIFNRCQEIGMLIDKLSTKQLQDIYPILIQSIFGWNGGAGWGFRTITRPVNPHEYDTLYHFFVPLGPMFRLCYRLLNDAQKFEIPITLIPEKLRQMLETGRYPAFYSDIINIDPFERRINSLALNAFDFYMLNFAIHGTIPIHKEYSAALTIQNDKLKSLYFFLAADYLCSFLPSDPESVVLPQNICSTKSSQIMPLQHVQPPTRSPKYLSMSAISHFSPSNNAATRAAPDLPRQFAWRSESVLYLFIDTWLRFECDVVGDLPSNEFMRVVRILVKQIHAFGNSAEFDHSSMASLRKIAQPMLNARMYIFLRTIMSRWPLDSSFSVVLELWLSYIQPWRYTYNRNTSFMTDMPISAKHENFILENIVCYTQIYVQLLSRFLSLDLTSYRNCSMVYRMLKVFGQSNLSEILRSYECSFSQSFGNATVNQSTFYSNSPRRTDTPIKGLSFRGNHPRNVHDVTSFRQDTYFLDDTYIPMFGDEIQDQVQNLIESLQEAALIVTEQIMALENQISEQFKGFFGWLRWWFSGWSGPNFGLWNMPERKRIPEILQICTCTLGKIFNIQVTEYVPNNKYRNISGISNELLQTDVSGEMDISNPKNISPPAMKKRALQINYAGDPELIPVQRTECTFLVRFFYQVSCKINFMYGPEITALWHKNSMQGKLSRQLLTAPQVVQIFDKSAGYSRLKEQYLGPRISLRFLASYYTLVIIAASFVFGQFIFNSPILGFFILLTISFSYLLISAVMDSSVA